MKQYLYDIINSTGTLTTQDVLIRIGMSILFGLLIFVSYRLTHEGSIYSAKFNITLLTLTILTTMVMTVIGNNVALSLGMVGALPHLHQRQPGHDVYFLDHHHRHLLRRGRLYGGQHRQRGGVSGAAGPWPGEKRKPDAAGSPGKF